MAINERNLQIDENGYRLPANSAIETVAYSGPNRTMKQGVVNNAGFSTQPNRIDGPESTDRTNVNLTLDKGRLAIGNQPSVQTVGGVIVANQGPSGAVVTVRANDPDRIIDTPQPKNSLKTLAVIAVMAVVSFLIYSKIK